MAVRMLKFKVTPYGTYESGQVVVGLPSRMEYQLMESGDADSAAVKDFAEAVVAAGMPRDFTVKVALGIVGQSNEAGATLVQDSFGVWQRYAASAPSQGIHEPVKLNSSGNGSMFTALCELLAQDGVKVDLSNGAVGGTSMYLDWTGLIYMGGRQNSFAYRGKRDSLGAGDPGHRGDQIFANGAVWEATTGNRHLVFWEGAAPITVAGNAYHSDPGVVVKETNLLTAASPPTFPGSPAVGNTVTDGAITWTCLTIGAKTIDAANVHVLRAAEDGFDPYFMCARVRSSLMRSAVSAGKRFVLFQNGQADAGVSTPIYTMALRMLAQYFGGSPYLITPIFQLSIFNPSQSEAAWDTLETSLSGGGLYSAPNYAASPVTTGLAGTGYHLATPGEPVTNFGFYYGLSLYRAFGTGVASMLQPSSPHVTVEGMHRCAQEMAPVISRILRNSAT